MLPIPSMPTGFNPLWIYSEKERMKLVKLLQATKKALKADPSFICGKLYECHRKQGENIGTIVTCFSRQMHKGFEYYRGSQSLVSYHEKYYPEVSKAIKSDDYKAYLPARLAILDNWISLLKAA